MSLRGKFDRVDEHLIEGWMIDESNPSKKLSLDIILDGKLLGSIDCDLFRDDLKAAGIGDGFHAFSYKPPRFFGRHDLRNIRFKIASSELMLAPDVKASGIDLERPTFSEFGGLWIDRDDWVEKLARRHRRGDISDELADRIFHFVRDGYIVIKGAVSAEHVDALNQDIEARWQNPPPGLIMETFEPDDAMHYITADIAHRGGRTKLLDYYAFSDVARRAIAAPAVVEFLTAIFDDAPKAFQSLNFWRGSQQAIHKDTAYVKVDGDPLALAATWLALEDIIPGSGELEYYVGSHRAPDFKFGGTSKWMENNSDEHAVFLDSLHKDAERYQHKRSSFLAHKGDVLVWHADLAHGGARVIKQDATRRSLVTHFCPASMEPFYRRTSDNAAVIEEGCVFVSQYADVV